MIFAIGGTMAKAENDTLWIQSTVACGMCKNTIEDNIKFERGVRFVEVNLETKQVMVIINPNKTDAEAIRTAISDLGYTADDVAANPEAYDGLPGCCQGGNSCSDKE